MNIAVTDVFPDDNAGAGRDGFFNPFRYAFSVDAKTVVHEAIGLILSYEQRFQLRRNKRRKTDQLTFDRTVEAVLSDLMHHHALGHRSGIAITRSKQLLGAKSRYRAPALSTMLPYILDLLAKPEMDYIHQDVAPAIEGYKKATTIRPSDRLLARMEEHGIGSEDFGEEPLSETIVLKQPKNPNDYWDEGGLAEYEDTELTKELRAEMDDINAWFAKAVLEFRPSPFIELPVRLDLQARRLRRIFTQGRFDRGGRMFGGFWLGMNKDQRRLGLRIQGETCVELDYGQVGSRILYGLAGREPPSDDHYMIAGYLQQREGIKKVMSAMMFASDSLSRFPKKTRALFRSGDRIAEVTEAILERHPLLRDQFHCGQGHQVQFIESQIMVMVVRTLKKVGIVALPVHDAVLVPQSAVQKAKEVMLVAFQRHARVEGRVDLGWEPQ